VDARTTTAAWVSDRVPHGWATIDVRGHCSKPPECTRYPPSTSRRHGVPSSMRHHGRERDTGVETPRDRRRNCSGRGNATHTSRCGESTSGCVRATVVDAFERASRSASSPTVVSTASRRPSGSACSTSARNTLTSSTAARQLNSSKPTTRSFRGTPSSAGSLH
jgi:hypothetical protein